MSLLLILLILSSSGGLFSLDLFLLLLLGKSYIIFLYNILYISVFRQYYVYVTDPKVKRLGMQCWMFLCLTALEAAVCVKFGRNQLPSIKLTFICAWILFLAIGTVFCVWLSVWWAQYSSVRLLIASTRIYKSIFR